GAQHREALRLLEYLAGEDDAPATVPPLETAPLAAAADHDQLDVLCRIDVLERAHQDIDILLRIDPAQVADERARLRGLLERRRSGCVLVDIHPVGDDGNVYGRHAVI